MKKSMPTEPLYLDKKFDITHLILNDHKPLKALIHIMKDNEHYTLSERKSAFQKFAPLLTMHAKPEEQVLYVDMKAKKGLRQEGLEGDVEHGLADQMVGEVNRTTDKDLWSVKVKVLAELVEHHIEEEEEETLPDFKKNSDLSERVRLGQSYIEVKRDVIKGLQEKPSGHHTEAVEAQL